MVCSDIGNVLLCRVMGVGIYYNMLHVLYGTQRLPWMSLEWCITFSLLCDGYDTV